MIHTISDVSEWESVAGSVSDGSIIHLVSDITFTSSVISTMSIDSNSVFHGNGNTITFDHGDTVNGIFEVTGGTILNVNIDGSNLTTSLFESGLVVYNSTANTNYGIIRQCTVSNLKLAAYSGGILPYKFGNTSSASSIDKCTSETELVGTRSGGIGGFGIVNTAFTYCIYKGNYENATSNTPYRGGIVSNVSDDQCTLTNCVSYCDITTSSVYCGGIIGFVSGDTTLSKCYYRGDISGSGSSLGGFIGRTEYGSETNIIDCYSNTSVSDTTKMAGFIGSIDNAFGGNPDSIVNFTDCYTTTEKFAVDSGDGVQNHTRTVADGGTQATNNTISDIDNALPVDWSTSVWVADSDSGGSDDYPMLLDFLKTDMISGYTDSSSEPSITINLINYASIESSYVVDISVSSNTIAVTGSTPASFSISPALPSGLLLNTSTGTIYGTPSATSSVASYTITATYDNDTQRTDIVLGSLSCITGDCMIKTTKGLKKVSDLTKRDRLVIQTKQTTKIRKILRFKYTGPLCLIKKNQFRQGCPNADILTTPTHKYRLSRSDKNWYYPRNNSDRVGVRDTYLYHIRTSNFRRDTLMINGLAMETWK